MSMQQKIKFNDLPEPVEKISSRLPTNTLSQRNRVQRWANFIAGFSIEFVEQCLREYDPSSDIVIDPFSGCGTTLVAARNLSFKGLGYEAHKLFHCLSTAKLGNYDEDDVQKIFLALSSSKKSLEWSESALKFIVKMYADDDIQKISKASFALREIPTPLTPLATAIFLKACELSCKAQTDGIYKAPDSKKKSIPYLNALEITTNLFREDISSKWYKEHWINQQKPNLFFHSSETMSEIKDNTVSVCVTSPPYLNNFDYAEMTRLQLYLLGWADSWGDISEKVRNKLVTNTTTALKGKKGEDYQMKLKNLLPKSLHTELSNIVAELTEQRKTRAGKKEYDYLVYPYYSQIFSVLKELYRILRKGGQINWVVADAALYGVHIKTHEHTKLLMEDLGFKSVEIKWIRKRGHRWILSKRDGAKEPLGEYHLVCRK